MRVRTRGAASILAAALLSSGIAALNLHGGRAESLSGMQLTADARSAKAAGPVAHYLWEASSKTDTVQAITWRGLGTEASWQVMPHATGMALSSSHHMMYVAEYGTNKLLVVSLSSGHTVKAITVGSGAISDPIAVAVSPSQKWAYVVSTGPTPAKGKSWGNGTVTPVDLATDVASKPIAVGRDPSAVAFSSDDSQAFVANKGSGTVSVIDVATRHAKHLFHVGRGPDGLAVSGSRMIVLNSGTATHASSSLNLVDVATDKVMAEQPLPPSECSGPDAVAVGPGGSSAWLACGSGVIVPVGFARFEVDQQLKLSIPHTDAHGSTLTSITVGTRGYVYVANYRPGGKIGQVWPVNVQSRRVGLPVAAGSGPVTLLLSPKDTTLYVSDYGGTSASANNSTIVRLEIAAPQAAPPVKLGAAPVALVMSPSGGDVYVSNGNAVTIVSTLKNRVARSVGLGSQVGAEALNPAGSMLYVARGSEVLPVTVSSRHVGAPIQLSGPVCGLAVTPDDSTLLASTVGSGSCQSATGKLAFVSLPSDKVAASTPLFKGPVGLAVAGGGADAVVAAAASDALEVVSMSTHKVVWTTDLGAQPTGLAVNEATLQAYVTVGSSREVMHVTLLGHVGATVFTHTSTEPSGIALSGWTRLCAITGLDSSSVTILGLTTKNQFHAGIGVDGYPTGLAFGPSGPLFLYPG